MRALIKALTFLLVTICCSANAQDDSWYFVFLNNKADKAVLPKEEVDKIMSGHMANIKRLASEGKLWAAGPFEGGGGMFIFKSPSLERTKEWLATDPGIQAARWNVEVMKFTPRASEVCQAPEPYEMLLYNFIRYTTDMTKYNVKSAPETARRHEQYMKKLAETGNVVTEGIFGDDGGILIMKGDLDKAVIEADPSLQETLYNVEYKKLYIAKGSFCEK